MPHENRFKVSVLNIALHPHTQDLYIGLLKDSFKLKAIIPIRGKRAAILGHVWDYDKSSTDKTLIGTILFFTQIDASKNWADLEKGVILDEDEQKERIKLPTNLMPDSFEINFVFFPDNHHLVFENYYRGHSIHPRLMLKFFQTLFSNNSIEKKYGAPQVTLIPSRDGLSKILQMHNLRRLEINIVRPNPDDNVEAEKALFEEMKSMNVLKVERAYSNNGYTSIEPNEHVTTLAQIASVNGVVIGRGRNEEDAPVVESTLDHPLIEQSTHDPNSPLGYLDKFRQFSAEVVKRIRARKKEK